MKIKGIVKQILKEELDNFDWIDDYGINPEKNKMSSEDILLLQIRNQLRGKKSYLNRDYIVDVEKDYGNKPRYYIAEKNTNGELSFFIYKEKEDFNLSDLEAEIGNSANSTYTSGLEYQKLYDDLMPLFTV
jgi:hypothetical protein